MVNIYRKKNLEQIIETSPPFPNPQRELEQYPTDSSTAAEILWTAYMERDIVNQRILDLGSGTGRLCVGASLLGAKHSICLDIDVEALSSLIKWSKELNIYNIIDVIAGDATTPPLRESSIDTIIMNPPFGVYRKGADINFLKSAMKLAKKIYTIHKSVPTSEELILKLAYSNDFRTYIISRRILKIPQMYETHIKKVHEVKVTLFLLAKNTENT